MGLSRLSKQAKQFELWRFLYLHVRDPNHMNDIDTIFGEQKSNLFVCIYIRNNNNNNKRSLTSLHKCALSSNKRCMRLCEFSRPYGALYTFEKKRRIRKERSSKQMQHTPSSEGTQRSILSSSFLSLSLLLITTQHIAHTHHKRKKRKRRGKYTTQYHTIHI